MLKRIAVYVYEGISLFHVSVPSAIFSDAYQGNSPFSMTFCNEAPGAIRTSNGMEIKVEHGLDALSQADILIFPSWIPEKAPSAALLKVILAAHAQDKVLVGLCVGAYVLAYSGILNNKQATTHWAYGEAFAERFPKVDYQENPLYIKAGNIMTSAGTAAAIDCCLNLLKEWEGAKAANHISRMMVSAPQRSGGQKQFLSRPVISTSSDDRLNAFVDKVLSDLSVPYTLEDAAKHCLMSKRTFTRHFHRHFSIGFVHWLKQARLNYSQELLEGTPLSITHIAEKSGFNTEQNFRKQFKLTFSLSPMAWRKVFQEGR